MFNGKCDAMADMTI